MKRILIVVMVTMLFAGCSDQKNDVNRVTSSSDNNTSFTQSDDIPEIKAESLQELVSIGMEKRIKTKEGSKDIIIDIPYYEGNSVFATFYNEKKQIPEVGVIYAEKLDNEYILRYIDVNPIDEKAPFWLVKSSGTMANGKRDFKVVYGYINNDSIDEIRIQYSDNITNSLQVDRHKTFLDVITGEKVTEKVVEGRDSDDNVIFSYK